MLGLLAGAYGMYRGNKAIGDIARNMPSESDIRSTFSGTQSLLDRMTNFNQYSGGAMDLATQAGNKGVETAMMMGQGGSQANAIKNRLRNAGINQAYQNFTSGLGNAARMQYGLDANVSGQMGANRAQANQFKLAQGQNLMNMGFGLMGGQAGLADLGANLSASVQALPKIGGLLGGIQ